MTELTKIRPGHLRRTACVYLRQSSQTQVEFNRESTERQYALVARASELGWASEQIAVIDEDLGVSGAGFAARSGFTKLIAEVALGQVGIVLGLEVSRLARNNADWYRLLDLCGLADTLIGDADGIYHPGLFNDRLLLGLKGTMSEAELHVLRARLDGGIRNKAARGELRRGLPVGFVWGDADGEIRFHPDEAVTVAIGTVFDRFTELGSARRVWLWFRSEGLSFPLQSHHGAPIRWVTPSYTAIHNVLTNPVYAGAYAYGKSRSERFVDDNGRLKQRMRRLPRSEWSVLIQDHHPGFIDWQTYEANQARLAANTRPLTHRAGGAVREGTWRCSSASPGAVIAAGTCGPTIAAAVSARVITAPVKPWSTAAAFTASMLAACRSIKPSPRPSCRRCSRPESLPPSLPRNGSRRTVRQLLPNGAWPSNALNTRPHAPNAAIAPSSPTTVWLPAASRPNGNVACANSIGPRPNSRVASISGRKRSTPRCDRPSCGWAATSSTSGRHRQPRPGTVRSCCARFSKTSLAVHRDAYRAHLTLRWRGGALTEIDVDLPRSRPATVRTDETTIDLVRRLATHYPDDVIAGILNRQQRPTARGQRFTANHVGNLRRHWNIPRFAPPPAPADGELVNVRQAAAILGTAPSTIHRWLKDGIIAGEQLTPAAPWRIRITNALRTRFVDEPGEGFITVQEATRRLGISRQAVWQRVKRGELEAIHVRRGRKKGLRIKLMEDQPGLFQQAS